NFMGSLHALEHALIGIAPVVAMCSRWDLGGISSAYFPELGSPAIFIYDGYEGGVGLSEKLYEKFDELIAITSDIIGRCPCENGCPSCVLSPKCGSGNQPMDKQGASLIASMILQNP
ncbi:MAG: DUF1998 domain-containing protein, partial [Deltaproteobacteria bacterium]|nr:DUF1998 domain-containing protein [Deltaproteobacteria bacterium]